MLHRRLLILGGLGLALLLAAQPVLARPEGLAAPLERVSVGSSEQGGGGSYAAISATGRFVAFESPASDLVAGQVDDSWDVIVRDRESGEMLRASTRTGGEPVYNPGDYTSPPAIAGDGRFIIFMSRAEDLVDQDNNAMPDIFIHDLNTRTSELVSVSSQGQVGNGASFNPAVSADGRFVAFQSTSSNLVESDTNNALDIFVRDRELGVTEIVSVTDTGAQGADPHEYGVSSVSMSADGRFVAFAYQNLPFGENLADGEPGIYIRDRQLGRTQFVAPGINPALSADGQSLAFVTSAALTPNDHNEGQDVYLFDRLQGLIERISSGESAEPGGPIIVSPPSLSEDGRFVAFSSSASLVPEDNNSALDVYVRDRQSGTTTLVSEALEGGSGNADSHYPAIAGDGSVIAFTSLASNLVADDANERSDVFVYKLMEADNLTAKPQVYLSVLLTK